MCLILTFIVRLIMEVERDDGFRTMAEVLPRNERTEKILAQRAAENAAKQEKAEQVSHRHISFIDITDTSRCQEFK